MTYTATQIAEFIGGQVIGDGSTLLHRFAPVNSAEPGDLTFAENEAFFEKAIQSAASAILIDSDMLKNLHPCSTGEGRFREGSGSVFS